MICETAQVMDRFLSHIVKDHKAGCWVWTGCVNNKGYPRFAVRISSNKWKSVYAHRWAMENLAGEIPVGMVIDHLCRNPRCVNPGHLEAVTQQINSLRGNGVGAITTRTNVCQRGHDMAITGYHRPNGKGRMCRECLMDRQRERRKAEKERKNAM